MTRISKLQDSLNNSCNYLISKQNQNGSWSDIEDPEISRDSLYKQPIVATAQAIKALIFNLKPEYIKRIQKATNYCNSVNTENINDSGILAWKLSGLTYSNIKIHNQEAEKILHTLISKQEPKGFWTEYPSTNYIVNYNVMEALKHHQIPDKSKDKFITWTESSRAKDGGWSFTPNEERGYITATTSSIFSLLNAGKNASSEIFEELRTFLEEQQFEDGHWNAKFEDGHRNGEATAAAALCLLIISENPFNKNVEKAIDYLMELQTKEGHYSREAIHSIRYINHLLSFYIYLKQNWETDESKILKKTIGNNKDVTNFYYHKFERHLRSKLNLMSHQSILTSKVLGTTLRAIKRRLEIVSILNEKGTLGVAEIIDNLREIDEYKYLKKKTHLTQIKSDVEYLKEINIVHEGEQGYYLGFKI
ncbi:MAG: terpene cyclase/mutase family protein [Candidatus Nanoarchaeia archaeon]|jgi:hypothetical protein|nr:terpene cyclase/mutase family protein [Candidatus Nanoarchaeia archaeon]|tara:strand:+ start:103 stop:1362 length:1260 start_codon:yes stop_codon:yes gene_type:complete